MLNGLTRVFQIPELKTKILLTLLLLAVCRIGSFIPVPGINGEIAVSFFRMRQEEAKTFPNGGYFLRRCIFSDDSHCLGRDALYLCFHHHAAACCLDAQLAKGNARKWRTGKRKINRWTRFLTVILSFLQSALFAKYALQMNFPSRNCRRELARYYYVWVPWLFYLITIFTMTTGTMFLMWVGEQITERGIGNGMSLIICLGILSQIPTAMGLILQQLNLDSQEPGQMNFSLFLSWLQSLSL